MIVGRVSRGSITSSIMSPARDVDVDDLAVGRDQLRLLGRRVLGLLDLLADDDPDHALGAHDGDLGARPRDDEVRLVGAPAHHVVAGAVGLAHARP